MGAEPFNSIRHLHRFLPVAYTPCVLTAVKTPAEAFRSMARVVKSVMLHGCRYQLPMPGTMPMQPVPPVTTALKICTWTHL